MLVAALAQQLTHIFVIQPATVRHWLEPLSSLEQTVVAMGLVRVEVVGVQYLVLLVQQQLMAGRAVVV